MSGHKHMPDRMLAGMADRTLEESFFLQFKCWLRYARPWKCLERGTAHPDVAPARFGVHRSALSLACGALTFERDVILRGRSLRMIRIHPVAEVYL